MSKVLVALSGGVDSAAAAIMLQQRGFDVSGIYMIMSDCHISGAEGAKKTAAALGIALQTPDYRRRFSDLIIDYFVAEYAAGRTPNPCTRCNPLVKFAGLAAAADELGCEKIATGHYARIDEKTGLIARAACVERDQSYMLCRLDRNVRERLIFPLADVGTKAEIRAIAAAHGLECASAPDSSENCFLPDADYAAFLRERLGERPGDIISPDGKPAGRHTGTYNYTVGQRKGLGSFGEPVFVERIDAGQNRVYLSRAGEGEFKSMTLTDCVWHTEPSGVLTVKIRSTARPCEVAQLICDGTDARAVFASPLRGVAPGQTAVFYSGDLVVGCGAIFSAEK